MRRYEVRVTPSALSQVSDAVSYVRDELGMPQAAARLLEELEGAVRGLAIMPNRFHAVDAEPLLSAGVRRMNVRSYSVFYREGRPPFPPCTCLSRWLFIRRHAMADDVSSRPKRVFPLRFPYCA